MSLNLRTDGARALTLVTASAAEPGVLGLPGLMELLGLKAERGLPDATFARMRVRARQALWRQGDRFDALYALGGGTFETIAVDEYGREQVLYFAQPGEIIGLDGFAGTYLSTAVALEPGWVARVSFATLRTLATRYAAVQRMLDFLFSEDIRRSTSAIALHGVWPSKARVAAFLLELARRTRKPVVPGSTVPLPMAGWELGSHLGLRPETVSRAVSALAAARLVRGCRRHAVLLDPPRLQAVAAGGALRKRPRWC